MKKVNDDPQKTYNKTPNQDSDFELWPEPEKPVRRESSLEPEPELVWHVENTPEPPDVENQEVDAGKKTETQVENSQNISKKRRTREKLQDDYEKVKETKKRDEPKSDDFQIQMWEDAIEDESREKSKKQRQNVKEETPPKKKFGFFKKKKNKHRKKSKKTDSVVQIQRTPEEERKYRRGIRKKNKRKRILKSMLSLLVILAIICGLIYGGYTAIKEGLFNVGAIEVVGNEIIDSEAVIAASEIQIGESIFLVDLNKANYNISKLVDLEKIEISKIMPNKVLITIKESSPLCAINFNGQMTYITREGTLIENGEYLRKTDIPVVFGIESVSVPEIGKKIEVNPSWRFQTVINILTDLENHGNLSKISEIRMTENNTYEIVTKNGTILVVWDEKNFVENANYIQNVLDENISNMIINLTSGTKPVVKAR